MRRDVVEQLPDDALVNSGYMRNAIRLITSTVEEWGDTVTH